MRVGFHSSACREERAIAKDTPDHNSGLSHLVSVKSSQDFPVSRIQRPFSLCTIHTTELKRKLSISNFIGSSLYNIQDLVLLDRLEMKTWSRHLALSYVGTLKFFRRGPLTPVAKYELAISKN